MTRPVREYLKFEVDRRKRLAVGSYIRAERMERELETAARSTAMCRGEVAA